jgi:hypothetical protein
MPVIIDEMLHAPATGACDKPQLSGTDPVLGVRQQPIRFGTGQPFGFSHAIAPLQMS